MKTEEIILANIKCDGCATTIKNELLKITGVENAEVRKEEDLVKISYDEHLDRAIIIKKLYSLGYPEATEENGLLLQVKSYASCMLGRIHNLNNN
ncbi:MAG: heavy-metal-associated domain-containing protein [Bacteroidetes bacterium]|nr:heavy-metal-associated domain-containing protein [Bacteroidota bacterium]